MNRKYNYRIKYIGPKRIYRSWFDWVHMIDHWDMFVAGKWRACHEPQLTREMTKEETFIEML